MKTFAHRIAGAPISWGICEAPGWGLQLPYERVLDEMNELGVQATELGSYGWLPTETNELRAVLDAHSLQLVGGFVPLVLHDPAQHDAYIDQALSVANTLVAAGATHFITAVVSDPADWQRPELSDDDWEFLLESLTKVDKITADFGLVQAVHPHVNTIIETVDEVQRFLDGCEVKLCLDTGHLSIGGADPVAMANKYFDRIGLVHLKDVNMTIASQMQAGIYTLMTGTQAGLFPALGTGDVDIAAVVDIMESRRYQSWYVIEQDAAITGELPAIGSGPKLDVARSVEFLNSLATSVASDSTPVE